MRRRFSFKQANWPALGMTAYLCIMGVLGANFVYSAVYGSGGMLSREQILLIEGNLGRELEVLEQEVAEMRNKTERLSDRSLDLDLLDEQARKVLGYVRTDEFVVN